MMFVFLVCLLVAESLAATVMPDTTTRAHHNTHHHRTHGTHPTREPQEHETFGFRYDPNAHMMLTVSGHKCYIYSMTQTELVDVHTSHGLHLLEGKLITMIDDTTATYQTMSHDDLMAASKVFAHTCNKAGWTTYKLN